MRSTKANDIKRGNTMNLEQSQVMADLRMPVPVRTRLQTKSAIQIAKKVLALAEDIGEHMVFKRISAAAKAKGKKSKRHTPQSWADRWISSDEFVLMEVSINAAASPNPPKNPKRVKHYIKAATSKEANEPIIIDINKREVGRSAHGFVPDVIVIDGKHRRQAKLTIGEKRIMAWIGKKALKKIKPSKIFSNGIEYDRDVRVTGTRLDTTLAIHSAVAPSVGLAKSVMRQDVGEGGSRPVDNVHGKKMKSGATGDCNACGARSSGSFDSDSSTSTSVPEMSDSPFSENKPKWDPKKPNMQTPGTGLGYSNRFASPNLISPGSGVGPRVLNKGASKSDYSRIVKSGKFVKDIHEDMDAEAPPGRESQVKELKKKFPKGSGAPFAIAWEQHNKAKRRH